MVANLRERGGLVKGEELVSSPGAKTATECHRRTCRKLRPVLFLRVDPCRSESRTEGPAETGNGRAGLIGQRRMKPRGRCPRLPQVCGHATRPVIPLGFTW